MQEDGLQVAVYATEKHLARLSFEDGSTQILRAASAGDLKQKILVADGRARASHQSITVEIRQPESIWAAKITNEDAGSRIIEAASRDELMLEIVKARAGVEVAAQKAAERPEKIFYDKDGWQVHKFQETHPDYMPSDANADRMLAWLESRRLPITEATLHQAFFDLWNNGKLENHEDNIPAEYDERIAEVIAARGYPANHPQARRLAFQELISAGEATEPVPMPATPTRTARAPEPEEANWQSAPSGDPDPQSIKRLRSMPLEKLKVMANVERARLATHKSNTDPRL
jgi:hypothetical protein